MGRVYRAWYTKKDANQQTIMANNGRPKRFYPEGWTLEYTDALGKTIRRKGGTTESQAKDALKKAESNVLSDKHELPTQKASELLCKDLQQRYLAALSRSAKPKHCSETGKRISDVLKYARVSRVKYLTYEAVGGALARLQQDRNLSARSINAYLQAVRGMLNWAVKKARAIEYNPLNALEKCTGPTVRNRRPLSDKECCALLAAALIGPLRRRTRNGKRNLSLARQAALAHEGRNLRVIYSVMIESGLRKNELQQLRWGDVDLESGWINLRAATTKNGKAASVPIVPSLLLVLGTWKAESCHDESAPAVKVTDRLLRYFNDDLVAIGLATRDTAGKTHKTDAAGRTLDLHCLRHTCAQRLINNGADPKTVQAIMRHSTATLTMGIYVKADRQRMQEAVAQLPALEPTALEELELAVSIKTGTDDASVDTKHNPAIQAELPSNRQGSKGESRKVLRKNNVTRKRTSDCQSDTLPAELQPHLKCTVRSTIQRFNIETVWPVAFTCQE